MAEGKSGRVQCLTLRVVLSLCSAFRLVLVAGCAQQKQYGVA